MRTSLWVCALTCIAGAASAQQRTPVGGDSATDTLRLTRRQAIATALLANPQLDIAREQTEQVRAQRVEGMAIPDPAVTASLDDETRFLGLSTSQSRNIGVGIVIPFPDKIRLQSSIGTENVRSSLAEYRLLQQQTASNAGQAYDGVLLAELNRRDFTEARDLSQDFLKKTQARFDAGTVARLDVIRAQVDVASAENDLIANSRDVSNARAALNRILGRPLGSSIVLLDSLSVPPELPDLDAVEQAALRSRPELADIQAQQRAAHNNSTLVREQSILPDITLSGNRDFKSDQGTLYSAGLAFPIPLLFWQHSNGDYAETHHRELELAATYRDTRAAVGQDVRTSYATADAAMRQVVFIRDQLLPSAHEAYRAAAASYGIGGLSALDVLDARRSLLDAESQYAQALAAANSARSDLERAAAVPLTSLATGVPRE
ncbi:MAG TPA: TolC family protein [Gemmatimonadaceae bacterium]